MRRAPMVGAVAVVCSMLAWGAAHGAAAGSPPRFAAPMIIDRAHSSGEPSIAVAKDGTLYISGPTGLGIRTAAPTPVDGGDLLWRSDDGGKHWAYLGSYDSGMGGGDSDIAVADDGAVIASGLSVGCTTVARSSDKGAHFVPNPLSCTNEVEDDRNWTAVHGQDVFTAFGGVDGLVVNRSLIASPAVVTGPYVEVDSSKDYQWPGVLAVDPRDGTAYLGWQTAGAPNDCDDGANKCSPGSASTKTPDVVKVSVLPSSAFGPGAAVPAPRVVATRRFDTFDAFVAVTVSSGGRVYAAWNERHPTVGATWTMLSSSADHGQHWSAPVKVNQVPTTAFPWISAGDGGRVFVSYYGTTAKGNSPEVVNGAWDVYAAYSRDGGRTFAERRVTTRPVHQGAVCTSGTGCKSGTRDLLDFFETATTADGCLVLTWTDNGRDVVDADGKRTKDLPQLLAFSRQTRGPGLSATRSCRG